MREGIGIVLTEGGHLRQARAGGEHGAVVVRLELDRIAQRHFSPRSLRILLTKPLPNSLRLPCIGSWLLRSPRRTVKWPLPPLEASSRLSSSAFIKNSLLHSSVEVNKTVEFNRPWGRFLLAGSVSCN